MQTKLLIKGKFTIGKGDPEKVLDPATGKTIVEVPEASEEQVNAAVQAAAGAFDAWSRTAPKDRATLLLKLADRIENFDDDDMDEPADDLDALKDLEIADDEADDEAEDNDRPETGDSDGDSDGDDDGEDDGDRGEEDGDYDDEEEED